MELKKNLLYVILENPNTPNKYSKSYMNLYNVVKLEKLEVNFKLPKDFLIKFNHVNSKYEGFLNNIPLVVVEKYFESHRENFNKYVFLEFQENEITDIKISELYYHLELFFKEVFTLAVMIANYYNLEIKLKKDSDQESDQDYI